MTDDYVLAAIDRAAGGMAFKTGRCFACGGDPTSGQGEHVIPLWMQRRFNLLDQKLTLINGTLIPYRKLTIPCCKKCNNEFLSDIENKMIKFLDKPDFKNQEAKIVVGR